MNARHLNLKSEPRARLKTEISTARKLFLGVPVFLEAAVLITISKMESYWMRCVFWLRNVDELPSNIQRFRAPK
jgi:hypothetical protein